jgi:competence protein ComGD
MALLQLRADKGFTFIEMLVVLAMTLMIMTVTMQYGYGKWAQLEAEVYLEQVLKDIQYVQSEAKKTNQYMELKFQRFDDTWGYEFIRNNQTVVLTRTFPKQIKVVPRDSTMLVCRYTNRGRPSISGHITFETDKGKYRLLIYLGEGIERLEKIS